MPGTSWHFQDLALGSCSIHICQFLWACSANGVSRLRDFAPFNCKSVAISRKSLVKPFPDSSDISPPSIFRTFVINGGNPTQMSLSTKREMIDSQNYTPESMGGAGTQRMPGFSLLFSASCLCWLPSALLQTASSLGVGTGLWAAPIQHLRVPPPRQQRLFGNIPGKDVDWFCWGHVAISRPITVAGEMGLYI